MDVDEPTVQSLEQDDRQRVQRSGMRRVVDAGQRGS